MKKGWISWAFLAAAGGVAAWYFGKSAKDGGSKSMADVLAGYLGSVSGGGGVVGADSNAGASQSKNYTVTAEFNAAAASTGKTLPKEVLDIIAKLPNESTNRAGKVYVMGLPELANDKDAMAAFNLAFNSGKDVPESYAYAMAKKK